MKVLLDANACLRYLLCDIEEQASEVSQFIEEGAEITVEVLAECVYVLDGVYKVNKLELWETLIGFLDEVECARSKVAKAALKFFLENNLDFVDCILLAEKSLNERSIATFDKKLKKALNNI